MAIFSDIGLFATTLDCAVFQALSKSSYVFQIILSEEIVEAFG